MRVVRKTGILILLAAAVFSVQEAWAVPTYLPESTYDGGKWYGYRYYYEEPVSGFYLRGRIDFSVYDISSMSGEESDWVDELETELGEMPGQYIYAYQVFNDLGYSDLEVSYFSVYALDNHPVDIYEGSIDSFEDPGGGVAPTPTEGHLESNQKVVWEFDGDFILKGEHSWFLVFCSDYSPVEGDYDIKPPEGKGTQGFPDTPEPATMALFGLGGAAILCRRRKSV